MLTEGGGHRAPRMRRTIASAATRRVVRRFLHATHDSGGADSGQTGFPAVAACVRLPRGARLAVPSGVGYTRGGARTADAHPPRQSPCRCRCPATRALLRARRVPLALLGVKRRHAAHLHALPVLPRLRRAVFRARFLVDVDDAVTVNAPGGVRRAHRGPGPDLVVYETSTPTARVDLASPRRLHDLGAQVCWSGRTPDLRAARSSCGTRRVDFVSRAVRGGRGRPGPRCGRPLSRGAGLGVTARRRQGTPSTSRTTGLRHATAQRPCSPIPAADPGPRPPPVPAATSSPHRGARSRRVLGRLCQLRRRCSSTASRGCPFHCSFCLWTQVITSPRSLPPSRPGACRRDGGSAGTLRRNGKGYFDDDTLTGRRGHVEALCTEIERRAGTCLSCMAERLGPDAAWSNRMAAAGCIGMKFGVESASRKVLRRAGKPAVLLEHLERWPRASPSPDQISRYLHVRVARGDAGQHGGDVRPGLPARRDMVQFSTAPPRSGTRYHDEVVRRGWLRPISPRRHSTAPRPRPRDARLSASTLPRTRARRTALAPAQARDPQWLARQVGCSGG